MDTTCGHGRTFPPPAARYKHAPGWFIWWEGGCWRWSSYSNFTFPLWFSSSPHHSPLSSRHSHNQRSTSFRHPVTGQISPENTEYTLQDRWVSVSSSQGVSSAACTVGPLCCEGSLVLGGVIEWRRLQILPDGVDLGGSAAERTSQRGETNLNQHLFCSLGHSNTDPMVFLIILDRWGMKVLNDSGLVQSF